MGLKINQLLNATWCHRKLGIITLNKYNDFSTPLCGADPKCVESCPRDAIRYERTEIIASLRRCSVIEHHLSKPLIESRRTRNQDRN